MTGAPADAVKAKVDSEIISPFTATNCNGLVEFDVIIPLKLIAVVPPRFVALTRKEPAPELKRILLELPVVNAPADAVAVQL